MGLGEARDCINIVIPAPTRRGRAVLGLGRDPCKHQLNEQCRRHRSRCDLISPRDRTRPWRRSPHHMQHDRAKPSFRALQNLV